MADNVQDTQGGVAGDGAPQGTTATTTTINQQPASQSGAVHGIDTDALRKRLERAKRGAMDGVLQRFGVKSIEELEAKVRSGDTSRNQRGKDKPKGGDPKSKQPAQPAEGNGKLERQLRQLATERDKQFQRYQRETALRKALELELAQHKAEARLREAAVRAGITLTDHALLELRTHAEKLKPEERANFDEAAFMVTLAERLPWLRNTTTEPATTGNAGSGAPPPPKPGDGTNGKPFDAMNASADDFLARMKKIGVLGKSAGR